MMTWHGVARPMFVVLLPVPCVAAPVSFALVVETTIDPLALFLEAIRLAILAVSGGPVSPPIDITVALLGKEKTLARLRHAIVFAAAAGDSPQ